MRAGNGRRLLLLGCGVLRREIRQLVARNGWPVELRFLDSALHVDLHALQTSLEAALARQRSRETVVFYGCCHPRMDGILGRAGTFRTEGQNCVEMLLGPERFFSELERGAYFLLEDWAWRWQEVMTRTFGTDDWDLIGEMFRESLSHLLAVRTPCSRDFGAAAEQAARSVALPLRWTDATLDPLESVLRAAIERRLGGAACPT